VMMMMMTVGTLILLSSVYTKYMKREGSPNLHGNDDDDYNEYDDGNDNDDGEDGVCLMQVKHTNGKRSSNLHKIDDDDGGENDDN
jgi:hypothetical protein